MARDLPKGTILYFYDQESKVFTGESGTSGDSKEFILPEGMTEVKPIVYDKTTEDIVFDIESQSWHKQFIDFYLNLSQREKNVVDIQREKDRALEKVISRLVPDFNSLLLVLENHLILSPTQQAGFDEYHSAFNEWLNLQ